MSAWIFRMYAPKIRPALIFRMCASGSGTARGFWNPYLRYYVFSCLRCLTSYFKSIIRKGLSHTDVTTLSYSPFFCICLNKHDINASLQWSI